MSHGLGLVSMMCCHVSWFRIGFHDSLIRIGFHVSLIRIFSMSY